MNSSDLICLLVALATFILGSLIPIIFYKAPFYIRFSLCKRMILVNFYTAAWIGFVVRRIVLNPYRLNHVMNSLIPACIWVIVFLTISVIFYVYFYKEAHYKCPYCGSRNTVKTDDGDGEYFDMDFHCRNCNKDFTIENDYVGGGWPD